MNERKRYMIMGLIVLVLISSIMFLCYRVRQNEIQQESQELQELKRSVDSQSKNEKITFSEEDLKAEPLVVYENMEGFYFLRIEQMQKFQEDLEDWLSAQGLKVHIVRIHEKVEETGEVWIFWCLLDDGQNKVKGTYDGDKFSFVFESEELPESEPEETTSESEIDFDEDKANQNVYEDVPNVDVGMVRILKLSVLPERINTEELVKEITAYLESKNEFRRNLAIESVDVKGNRICIIFVFETELAENNALQVEIEDQKYHMTICDL